MYDSLEEVKNHTKRLLKREVEELENKKYSNINYIKLIRLSLYIENFDRLFDTRLKKYFKHLDN